MSVYEGYRINGSFKEFIEEQLRMKSADWPIEEGHPIFGDMDAQLMKEVPVHSFFFKTESVGFVENIITDLIHAFMQILGLRMQLMRATPQRAYGMTGPGFMRCDFQIGWKVLNGTDPAELGDALYLWAMDLRVL